MKVEIVLLLIVFFTVFTGTASAHPGRTDANGGHTCRTNCASWGLGDGEYHTHGTQEAPIQTAPQRMPFVQKQQVVPTTAPAKRVVVLPTKKPTRVPYKETAMDKKKLFKVVRVNDGDSIDVVIRGNVEKVRLLAVDAPEISNTQRSICYGREATGVLANLVSSKYVRLVDDKSQGNRDAYNRLLRYIYDGDIFINAELVKRGSAYSYKSYPTKYLGEFNKLESQAKAMQIGLWKECKR